jgi:DNA-binding MarR family transcriptional regulator/predicted GNAT family N-acyltransferase
MDFISELGQLALASRLRRLSDRLMGDVASIYKAQNIDFEARWFPIFYLLSRNSSLSILDIAKSLSITHPAVNQIAADIIEKGLISSLEDKDDKRKRLLQLTEKGKLLIPALERIWSDIGAAVDEIVQESGYDVIDCIQKLESSITKKSIFSRYTDSKHQREIDSISIEIINYEPALKNDFKRLNKEWIDKYFTYEKIDELLLSNPEEQIIQKGGHILFAKKGSEIVGTCALLKVDSDTFELTKMAVTEKHQGKHVGKKLAYKAIELAIQGKARTIILETNSILRRAISLYTQLGFRRVIDESTKEQYSRTDTKMKLDLGAN